MDRCSRASCVSTTFSVIIPTFNAAQTVEACLTSVAAQTFRPLEVLVIDDASKDDTLDAVMACEPSFRAAGITLSCFELEQNRGPSVARNVGISNAKGSHLAFLDADDIWDVRKLEIVAQQIGTPHLGLICHSYTESRDDFDVRVMQPHSARLLSIHRMLLRNPAQTSCAVINRLSVLRFDEEMSYCEDYDLWLRIAEEHVVIQIIGQPLTKLGRPQLSAGGLSENTLRMRLGEARVYYKYCSRAWGRRALLLPVLMAFSILKHIYSWQRRAFAR